MANKFSSNLKSQFSRYNMCFIGCLRRNDSIPFNIYYRSPGDFGNIFFNLSSLKDTVFYATIIWMGKGKIKYPSTFSKLAPFINSSVATDKPNDLWFIYADTLMTNHLNLFSKVDTAWNAVKSLEITNLFNEKGFKSAIYLYTPTVGGVDLRVAKWIIFLYHNDQINAISYKKVPAIISPNPTYGEVSITLNVANQDKTIYNIINQSGQLVAEGDFLGCSHKLNLSILSPGLYYLKLIDKNKRTLATEKIILE